MNASVQSLDNTVNETVRLFSDEASKRITSLGLPKGQLQGLEVLHDHAHRVRIG